MSDAEGEPKEEVVEHEEDEEDEDDEEEKGDEEDKEGEAEDAPDDEADDGDAEEDTEEKRKALIEKAAEKSFELRKGSDKRGAERWNLRLGLSGYRKAVTQECMEIYRSWLKTRLEKEKEEHGEDVLARARADVDFSQIGLDDEGVEVLLKALVENKVQVALMKLFKNRLSREGMQAICNFVKEVESIGTVKELHLTHNQFDDDDALRLLRTLSSLGTYYPPTRDDSEDPDKVENFPVWIRFDKNKVNDPNKVLEAADDEAITICCATDRNKCGTSRCYKCTEGPCPLVHLYSFTHQGNSGENPVGGSRGKGRGSSKKRDGKGKGKGKGRSKGEDKDKKGKGEDRDDRQERSKSGKASKGDGKGRSKDRDDSRGDKGKSRGGGKSDRRENDYGSWGGGGGGGGAGSRGWNDWHDRRGSYDRKGGYDRNGGYDRGGYDRNGGYDRGGWDGPKRGYDSKGHGGKGYSSKGYNGYTDDGGYGGKGWDDRPRGSYGSKGYDEDRYRGGRDDGYKGGRADRFQGRDRYRDDGRKGYGRDDRSTGNGSRGFDDDYDRSMGGRFSQ